MPAVRAKPTRESPTSMLEIVQGTKRNVFAANELIARLRDTDLHGTLYVGYPILATSEEPISLDGLLVCLEHGIVVFDFLQPDVGPLFDQSVEGRQEDLYNVVYQKLLSFKPLRAGRG